MLFGSLGELEEIEKARANEKKWTQGAKNAALESWTVHLRNLHAFFFYDRAKDGDMLAIDYFDAGVWQERRPTSDLAPDIDRVAKEIVHLTYARTKVTPETKGWDVGPISQWVGKEAILPFVGSVPRGRVRQDFKGRCRLATAIRPLILVADED
jgi:hypothetical protein